MTDMSDNDDIADALARVRAHAALDTRVRLVAALQQLRTQYGSRSLTSKRLNLYKAAEPSRHLGPRRTEPCPCGSSVVYWKCHWPDFDSYRDGPGGAQS